MYKIGWFSTGRGSGSCDLLNTIQDAIISGKIEAEIEFVFCSREPGESEGSDAFIKLVHDYDIPLICYSYHNFKSQLPKNQCDVNRLPQWRLNYDREVMQRLNGYNPNISVLAGYMLIVGPEMCQRYDMVNLHPAKPDGPTGTWRDVIWELMRIKAGESGVMMHLVTPELDRGPVVTYCTYTLKGDYFDELWQQIKGITVTEIKNQEGENNKLFRLIRRHGLQRELPLIIATIKSFIQGDVKVKDNDIVDLHGKHLEKGYDLTAEIEDMISRFKSE